MYRWIEHTSELELAIDAPTEAAVFADAFAAYVELVRDNESLDGERREIELRSAERATLLADWLEELVYLADAQQFVPERLTDMQLEDGGLRATVRGHQGEPRALVKAVTRHRLDFRGDARGFTARVVLDV